MAKKKAYTPEHVLKAALFESALKETDKQLAEVEAVLGYRIDDDRLTTGQARILDSGLSHESKLYLLQNKTLTGLIGSRWGA